MLARLARAAPPESDSWIFAHRHLAELAVEHDPWRAALFARRVIAHRPEDDGAWAVLGLAQSLLGHCRFAVRAYEQALALAPENPWYAHNLGHLYDVALGRAKDALPLLARATTAQPDEPDIAASYAHALARCGKVDLAKRVLRRATRRGATADHTALARWLDEFGLDLELDAEPSKTRAAAPAVPARGESTRRRARACSRSLASFQCSPQHPWPDPFRDAARCEPEPVAEPRRRRAPRARVQRETRD